MISYFHLKWKQIRTLQILFALPKYRNDSFFWHDQKMKFSALDIFQITEAHKSGELIYLVPHCVHQSLEQCLVHSRKQSLNAWVNFYFIYFVKPFLFLTIWWKFPYNDLQSSFF